jgi:hypothetical protein
MKYAENTSVSVERSKAEIERTLARYGAEQFMSGWDMDNAYIAFKLQNRFVKFMLELPRRDDPEFLRTPGKGLKRTPQKAMTAWEQACRQRWRALALVIKAKLEAVETGITTFEEEFLAHIVLPDGSTVGQHMIPQIETSYQQGKMPKMLPFNRK